MPSRTSSNCGVSTIAVTPICFAGGVGACACAIEAATSSARGRTQATTALITRPDPRFANIQYGMDRLSKGQRHPCPGLGLTRPLPSGMKPARFAYERPADLAEAIGLLATHGEDARPIAGGQSLMPVLAFRLATPSVLVDLRRLPGPRRDRDRRRRRAARRPGALARHRATTRGCGRRIRCCAAAIAACRALPDPQPRHGRRQPRACRPGGRTARRSPSTCDAEIHVVGAGRSAHRSRPASSSRGR